MIDALLQLGLFTAKTFILFTFILLLVAGLLAVASKSKTKGKSKGKVSIKNLNEKYAEIKTELQREICDKDTFKKLTKAEKAGKKSGAPSEKNRKNAFVLNFHGDIKASAVTGLREEINAILSVAKHTDEVIVRLESAGGMVHAYGLAAAQLLRITQNKIPLTIVIDKIAASGGYLMACTATKILAAPFAIIGSIGVVAQLPNFHRLLQENHIDYEMLTAGQYKRTLTLFGPNTKDGRAKLQEEIEEIHHLFKDAISQHRPKLDINKVATGEHWLGTRALELALVDGLDTSDDYLLQTSKKATLYEISYQMKKPLAEKLAAAVKTTMQTVLNQSYWH